MISNEADPPGGIPVSLRPPMMGAGRGLLVPSCQPAGTVPSSVACTPNWSVTRQHLIAPVLLAAFLTVNVHFVPEPLISIEPLTAC